LAKISVECKLFDKWSLSEIGVKDPGLAQVVSPRPVVIPLRGKA